MLKRVALSILTTVMQKVKVVSGHVIKAYEGVDV
jgi:hypothetical protein